MKNLIFQLHGNIVSWGTAAGDQNRSTERVPTKSAIMGLLSSALGYKREEDKKHQRLSKKLSFGVAVESYGAQMRDYHTATPPAENQDFIKTRREELQWETGNPVITFRSYRTDGIYTIVLSNDEEQEDLTRFKEALNNPHFTPYLGRKSCPPSIPFLPKIYENLSPLKSVLEYWLDRSLPLNHNHLNIEEQPDQFDFYLEGKKGTVTGTDSYEVTNRRERQRRDQPVSREQWTFDNRWEEKVHVRRK